MALYLSLHPSYWFCDSENSNRLLKTTMLTSQSSSSPSETYIAKFKKKIGICLFVGLLLPNVVYLNKIPSGKKIREEKSKEYQILRSVA